MADGGRLAACVALGFLPALVVLAGVPAPVGLVVAGVLAGAVLPGRPVVAGLLVALPTAAVASVVLLDERPAGLLELVVLAAVLVLLAHVGAGLALRRGRAI